MEMNCEALAKATQVDGVYSADPKKDPNAVRYDALTYAEVLARDLKVMDGAAIALARDNNLPVIVFSIEEPGNLLKVLRGEAGHGDLGPARAIGSGCREASARCPQDWDPAGAVRGACRSEERVMAAGKFDLKDLERRMRGAIDTLKKEFAGLRTGRASVHLLDPVVVNVYGAAHADQPGGHRVDAGRAHHLRAGLGQGPGRARSRRRSARPTSGSTRSSTAR